LLNQNGESLEVHHIYKLPEYKVVKMVRILPNSLSTGSPTKVTYLKPTQYIRLNGQIIKAKDLVDKIGIAEYERFNILNFYLLNVNQESEDSSNINEFVDCNGLEVSVYNTKHPLNNRFKKYSKDLKETIETKKSD
jgi:hypothetical protein